MGGGQNLLALQFQYIVTLANCNKASIKKSSAASLTRNKMSSLVGGPSMVGGLGPGAPDPPKSGPGLTSILDRGEFLPLDAIIWWHGISRV